MPVLTDLRCVTSTTTTGTATSSSSAMVRRSGWPQRCSPVSTPTSRWTTTSTTRNRWCGADHRRPLECVQWGTLIPPFYPEHDVHLCPGRASVWCRSDGLTPDSDRLRDPALRRSSRWRRSRRRRMLTASAHVSQPDLGAFGPERGVVNDGAMAVFDVRHTVTASGFVCYHSSSLRASTKDAEPAKSPAACRDLPPAEFVQAIVVDTEVVGDLADDRDGHLVDDLPPRYRRPAAAPRGKS